MDVRSIAKRKPIHGVPVTTVGVGDDSNGHEGGRIGTSETQH